MTIGVLGVSLVQITCQCYLSCQDDTLFGLLASEPRGTAVLIRYQLRGDDEPLGKAGNRLDLELTAWLGRATLHL